ncbi:cysteine proteinase [Cadophora sp. DSE1049]|nr:cysteine proteinase [Cadophora sp. DSE1049]
MAPKTIPSKRVVSDAETAGPPKRQKGKQRHVINLDDESEEKTLLPDISPVVKVKQEGTPEPGHLSIVPWSRPLTKKDWLSLYTATELYHDIADQPKHAKRNPFPECAKYKETLTAAHWQQLEDPNGLLDDEIINSCLALMRGPNTGVVLLNSFWFRNLEDKWLPAAKQELRNNADSLSSFNTGSWTQDGTKNDFNPILRPMHDLWSPVKRADQGVLTDTLRAKFLVDVGLILLPLHTAGHWMLMSVHIRDRRINIWNSISGHYTNIEKRAQVFMRRFLRVFLGYEEYIRKPWETLDSQGSQQDDGAQCGVFVLSNAFHLLQGRIPRRDDPPVDPILQRRHLQLGLLLKEDLRGESWTKAWGHEPRRSRRGVDNIVASQGEVGEASGSRR